MNKPTHERALQLLNYSPETGLITWRCNRGRQAKAGQVAGNVRKKDGYIQIKIDGRLCLAHVLAVFISDGVWPSCDVDHRNGIRADNRRSNLRHATHAQNVQNQGKRSDNKSGLKGVSWSRLHKQWRAQIQRHGKRHNIGLFRTPIEAHAAYELKAVELFGEFKRAS